MQDLKFHELADIFPLLSGEQLQELASDIKANGLREQITLFEDKILDGRNRYNALKLAGLDPLAHKCLLYCRTLSQQSDPVAFVISQNIQRRHLTNDQRAQIAAELYAKLPKNKVGGDRKPLSQSCDNRTNNPPSADSQKEKVAKQMRVSIRGMERAAAIQNKDPNTAAEVKAGTKTIKQAEKELKPKAVPNQLDRIYRAMADGKWRTLEQIAAITGDPITSISAQLRHLRKAKFGEHVIEKAHIEGGLFVYRLKVAGENGDSDPIPNAVRREPKISRDDLSLTAQQKLDSAMNQEKKRLQQQFEAAVAAEVDKRVRRYMEIASEKMAKEREEYKRVMEGRKGFMTREVYRDIRACLHPDRGTHPERFTASELQTLYSYAFNEFSKLEKCILDEKESPTPKPPNLPRTMAEWEAMRRKVTAEKAARKNQPGSVTKAR